MSILSDAERELRMNHELTLAHPAYIEQHSSTTPELALPTYTVECG